MAESIFSYVALGIIFIMFVAFSIGINEYMTNHGFLNWWQIIIPLALLWLFYVGIVYVLIGRKEL